MGVSAEQVAGEVYGTAKEVGLKLLDNVISKSRSRWDRYWNHLYGEASANAADLRTRALYNDFYSPEALLRQYETAGLSPSLMFGGTPGQGGMQGAMGSNAGIQTPIFGMSALEAAQVANMFANTEKTKAETRNIETDTERQEIQKGIEELQSKKYKNEFNLLNTGWVDRSTGQPTSLFEQAVKAKNYAEFQNYVFDGYQDSGDNIMEDYVKSEEGQKNLRSIYKTSHTFSRDITVLTEETLASSFQISIIQAMDNTNFAALNADAAVKYLEANIETAELTKEQKGAWNNLIDSIRDGAGDTTANIVMILAMILNNAASNWHMPNINNSTHNTNNFVSK